MTIDSFIEEIEDNRLEKALSELSNKDLIGVYLNALEYQRAKLMRANFIPEEDNEEKDITINIIG